MGAPKIKIPGSSRQDNLPVIKSSLIIFGLMFIGFMFLLLQLVGIN